MQGVLTSYNVGNKKYASYILGSDLNSIQQCLTQRNLDHEKIDSCIMDVDPIPDYSKLSLEEFDLRIEEILHTACFLSFIAVKAKTINIEEALGDNGVVHEIAHYITERKKKSLSSVRDLIVSLQKKAVGLYEPV